MKKKIFSVALAACMLGSVLTGCGDTETSTADTAKADSSKVDSSKSDTAGELEISFSHFFDDSEAFYAPFQLAIDNFNADNAGKAKIVQDILSNDAYELQIETRAAANDLPDINLQRGTTAKKYGSEGKLVDLTQYFKDNGIFDKYYAGSFTEHVIDGKYYTLPLEAANYGFILYNKAIFDEVGITSFPATYDEMIAAGDKLSKAGYIPLALGDKEKWPADSLTFSSFVNPYVGNAWFEDIFMQKGNSKFTDAEFVKALTDFQGLATKGVFNKNLVSISNDDRLSLYMTGKAAMVSAGNWECGIIASTAPEIAATTFADAWPVPSSDAKAKKSVETSSAWGIAVSSQASAEKLPYIVDFLSNYITNDEFAKLLAETKSSFVPYDFEYDTSKVNIVTAKMVDLVKTTDACLNWDSSLDATVREVYQTGLQELLVGSTTPEKLAKQMQDAYAEVLANK